MPLTEQQRAQLDNIVQDMEANGESPDDIQFVVSDFKSKYDAGADDTQQGGGMGKLAALLGAGGLAAAGLAFKKPELMKRGLRKGFDVFQGARHWGALSGLATPKSVIGNVGAPFIAAAERKSMAPIKEFFKPETAKTWVREMVNPEVGREVAEKGVESATRMWNPFGRMMSAGDVATRGALKRAGLTESEAARQVLQTPIQELGITGRAAKVLESRPGQAAVMYRRTPFNTVMHGAENIIDRPGASSIAASIGALQGSAEDGVGDPLAIALTSPAAGVYGLPYLLGAAGGKVMTGQAKRAIESLTRGMSPIPEFGMDVFNPGRPIAHPAAGSAYEKLKKLLTTRRSY